MEQEVSGRGWSEFERSVNYSESEITDLEWDFFDPTSMELPKFDSEEVLDTNSKGWIRGRDIISHKGLDHPCKDPSDPSIPMDSFTDRGSKNMDWVKVFMREWYWEEMSDYLS
jgi:hypothetical protein